MPSLYANLLDPKKASSATTISSAPVKYEFKASEAPQEEKKPADGTYPWPTPGTLLTKSG